MQKIFKILKIINIVAVVALLPLMIIAVLYGIDGYMKHGITDPVFIACIGYIIAALSALLSLWKEEFFYLSLFGWALFAIGNKLDVNRASADNDQLCITLRADPKCVEDECGFICPGMATGYGICKDKDPILCENKVKNEEKAARRMDTKK